MKLTKGLKKEIKENRKDAGFNEPGECPYCGKEIGEDFDIGDIFIDTDTGFITLRKDCDCGKKLELFYDYDRTELREED